jgi:hypothetical protein
MLVEYKRSLFGGNDGEGDGRIVERQGTEQAQTLLQEEVVVGADMGQAHRRAHTIDVRGVDPGCTLNRLLLVVLGQKRRDNGASRASCSQRRSLR